MILTDDQLRSLRAQAEAAMERVREFCGGIAAMQLDPSTVLSLVEEVERARAMRPARIAGVAELERENRLYEAAFEAIEHALFGDKQNRSRDDLEMRADELRRELYRLRELLDSATGEDIARDVQNRIDALHAAEDSDERWRHLVSALAITAAKAVANGRWAVEENRRAAALETEIERLTASLALLGGASTIESLAATAEASRDCVDPAEIIEQRAKGWPDFHPETYCHRCGRRNLWSWYVDSAEWNRAFPDDGVITIACPTCFAEAWERATGRKVTWALLLSDQHDALVAKADAGKGLAGYAWHHPSCSYVTTTGVGGRRAACDCGLVAALARWEAANG